MAVCARTCACLRVFMRVQPHKSEREAVTMPGHSLIYATPGMFGHLDGSSGEGGSGSAGVMIPVFCRLVGAGRWAKKHIFLPRGGFQKWLRKRFAADEQGVEGSFVPVRGPLGSGRSGWKG